MSPRALAAALLLLLTGSGILAQTKPAGLPIDETVTCAVHEPETPIDGLLLEIVVEKPRRPVCDIVLDMVVPPLRLRHVQSMTCCPCFKNCCKRMGQALENCCARMQHCLKGDESDACLKNRTEYFPGSEQECSEPCGHPYPHCPAGCPRRCETEDAQATQEDVETLDNTPAEEPEVLDVMPKEEPEQVDVMPHECEDSDEPCTSEPAPPAACPTRKTCPYLLKKAEKPQGCKEKKEKSCATTPLDCMDRLMKAFQIYRKAEHCRVAGETDRACRLYEKVKKLCPGSRFEHLACKRLEQIYATKGMSDAHPGIEEAEPLPCQPAEVHPNLDRLRGENVKLVDELRAKAHQLLDEGHYAEARALAEVAYALNNDCEKAFLLLAKAKALLEAPKPEEKTEEAEPGSDMDEGCYPDQSDGEDAEVQPPCEGEVVPDEPPTCPSGLIQPPLPPVDPKIVDALEKVLRAVGDPTMPRLIIQMDPETGEEQEDAVSGWPYPLPPANDGLYIESSEEELFLEDEEEPACTTPQDEARDCVNQHLQEMLQEVVDCLRQQVCCDVEIGAPGVVRGQMTFQVGAVQCSVLCDGWGHRFVLVSLTPEASGDLRAIQQAHNDRVLHWIELMNSGGNQPDDDSAAAEEDGAEEQDLLYYDEPNPL